MAAPDPALVTFLPNRVSKRPLATALPRLMAVMTAPVGGLSHPGAVKRHTTTPTIRAMRWNVSLTAPQVRDSTRPWTDIAASVMAGLCLSGALEAPSLSRDKESCLCLDACLEAPAALVAYAVATRAAELALRSAGVGMTGWSSVVVVSRPASPDAGWRSDSGAAVRPVEW